VLVERCLAAGKHVWFEKPPAATAAELERLRAAAADARRIAMVGMKKMFFPANEKAKQLMDEPGADPPSLVLLEYPQYVPTVDEFRRYRDDREPVEKVRAFLDHLVHPVSLMLFLLGMPETLCYQRSEAGAAAATFVFATGTVASLAMPVGGSANAGMERTTIFQPGRGRIVVANNHRVSLHRPIQRPYGASPSFFQTPDEQAALVWEPEFSLGQLYNKGLFLLGYYGEVNEFARAILEDRPPSKGTLEQATQATRIFEAFAEGPGKMIPLARG